MPGTLPSDRFTSGFKAGSSSDINRPLTGQELIFIECVNEESRQDKVRVALLADILTDLGFSLEGLTETVILRTAEGGSVTLDIKDGLIQSRVYGTGTESDPYLVYTAGDLSNVRPDLGAYYLQMADIDISGTEWMPIGDISVPFTGSYNGNGKTITGVTVHDDTPNSYAGLFGCAMGANLENITIVGCDIAATTVVGALCAIATDCSVYGCIASGDVGLLGGAEPRGVGLLQGAEFLSAVGLLRGVDILDLRSCGGLIGTAMKIDGTPEILNCHTNVDIIAQLGSTVGGLNGISTVATSQCSSRGEITGTGRNAGGLAGIFGGSSQTGMDNCYSQVDISGSFDYVGGLIGQADDYADNQMFGDLEIINCYASGNLGLVADGKGGFSGSYNFLSSITTTNCVWLQDTEINVGITDGQVTPHTVAWMQDKDNYITDPWAWNFDLVTGIWEILPSQFPTLQVEP